MNSPSVRRLLGHAEAPPAEHLPEWGVLFEPTFHAEIGLIVCGRGAAAELTAVVFAETHPSLGACRLPVGVRPIARSERVPFDWATVPEGPAEAMRAMQAETSPGLVFGGMRATFRLRTAEGVEIHSVRVAASDRFHDARISAALLRAAWETCTQPALRNALADCAIHLGVKFPRFPWPEPRPVTRLLVLGTDAERAEWFAALPAVTAGNEGKAKNG